MVDTRRQELKQRKKMAELVNGLHTRRLSYRQETADGLK